jgi:hypothetical protein
MARLFRLTILMVCFLCAGRAFAAGGTCPTGANYVAAGEAYTLTTLSGLGVTSCYFVSQQAGASDSNNGTSESTPWLHLPGMAGCTATCASTTPAPGNGFIFRGGDSWGLANFPISFTWSGTAANPMYIGVDQGWYSGSAWTRPIWTCGNNAGGCGGAVAMLSLFASFAIFDNFEITGLNYTGTSSSTAGTGVIAEYSHDDTVENFYWHGVTYTTPWANVNGPANSTFMSDLGGEPSYANDTARYNVIDMTDSGGATTAVVSGPGVPVAYGNYMKYVWTGLDSCGDNWHDNVVDHMSIPLNSSVSGASYHQNAFKHLGACYNSVIFDYDNIVSNQVNWNGGGGAVKFWLNGLPGNYTTYAFNNLIYNNVPGNVVDNADQNHRITSSGTLYFFNNTIQCGTDSNMGVCSVGMTTGGTLNAYLSNNQWIQSSTTTPLSCTNNPGGSCTETNDLFQTLAQANSQGYTDTSVFAFQPVNNSGSTVAPGTNVQPYCATIATINSNAGNACLSDTTYACTYNSTNHTVSCPTRETVARTAEPNIGAYQFSSDRASIPNAPAGLTVSVQ